MNRDWIMRVAASAAIRKIVYIVVAAALGLVMAMVSGKAHAGKTGLTGCDSNNDGCNASEAYSMAVFKADYYGIDTCHNISGPAATYDGPNIVATTGNGPITEAQGAYSVGFRCNGAATGATMGEKYWYDGVCPAPSTWNSTTKRCTEPNTCATKPNLKNKSVAGNAGLCSGGCEYAVDLGAVGGKSRRMNVGTANERYFSSDWAPTGGQCSTGTPTLDFDPEKEVCASIAGGFGECIKPNGQHCMKASTGKSICWNPGATPADLPETGPKITADGSLGGDRQVPPNVPAAPPGQQNPTPTPGGNTTTVINGTIVVTGTSTGTGNSSGQGNTGVTGDRNGNGSRNGTGDEGEGEGDDDPGDVGEGVGELYDGDGKTVGDAFDAFQARIGDAPLIDAAGNFFTVSGGGACPVFTLAATTYWQAMAFDYHCNGAFAAMLTLCGYVLLAVAAFAAFRIAVY